MVKHTWQNVLVVITVGARIILDNIFLTFPPIQLFCFLHKAYTSILKNLPMQTLIRGSMAEQLGCST